MEAMINGIPVVASDRGSAVDALGRYRGLILPLPHRFSDFSSPADRGAMTPWVDAIIQLWDDPVFYDEHCRLALAETDRRPRMWMERHELPALRHRPAATSSWCWSLTSIGSRRTASAA